MDKTEIAAQLTAFLRQQFPSRDAELSDATNLLEEWFVDSMEIVQTVLFIESNFGIDFYRADINGANFKDIATLSALVADRLGLDGS